MKEKNQNPKIICVGKRMNGNFDVRFDDESSKELILGDEIKVQNILRVFADMILGMHVGTMH
jgi:hypothetical protein